MSDTTREDFEKWGEREGFQIDEDMFATWTASRQKALREAQQVREELEPILEFLYGAGELDGTWFGDVTVDKPRYWWRSKLREVIKKWDRSLGGITSNEGERG